MNRIETGNSADLPENREASIPTVDARMLTAGGATVTITLDDQQYTLRITRTQKLILTK